MEGGDRGNARMNHRVSEEVCHRLLPVPRIVGEKSLKNIHPGRKPGTHFLCVPLLSFFSSSKSPTGSGRLCNLLYLISQSSWVPLSIGPLQYCTHWSAFYIVLRTLFIFFFLILLKHSWPTRLCFISAVHKSDSVIHTHTHTHTHIYIYIYINSFS